jgi:NADH dehydrogenase FAD-containing subunit
VLGLASGGLPVQAGSLLSRASNLELTWEPASSADRIEFEIFAAGSTLSCAARDDGHFRIPSAQLHVLEADPSAALIVRRVRTVPLEMTGVETAYARLAVARSISLRVE